MCRGRCVKIKDMKAQVMQVNKGHFMDGLIITANDDFGVIKECYKMDIDVAERLARHITKDAEDNYRFIEIAIKMITSVLDSEGCYYDLTHDEIDKLEDFTKIFNNSTKL